MALEGTTSLLKVLCDPSVLYLASHGTMSDFRAGASKSGNLRHASDREHPAIGRQRVYWVYESSDGRARTRVVFRALPSMNSSSPGSDLFKYIRAMPRPLSLTV